jgi:predicted phosphodiesterase
MRIAVLADIHGNLLALEAVLRHARGRGVDAVVNLGDSLSGPLMPLETAQFLMAQGWMTIAGNHERQLLTLGPTQWGLSDTYTHARLSARELDWLAGQPSTGRFLPEVFICHGTPQSDLDPLLETLEPTGCRTASAREVEDRLGDAQAEVILCGHTHVPRAVRTRSGQLVVNPGSVGLPAWEYGDPPARIETGSPDARYATLERRGGHWSTSLHAVPYDHHAMADLAAARGRPDWESALRTGYMPSL